LTALHSTGVEARSPADLVAAIAVPEALGFLPTRRENPQVGPPDLRIVPDPDHDAKAVAAAEERLAAASEKYESAASAHAEAGAEVDRIAARGLQLQAEIDELRRALAALEDQAEGVEEEAAEAEEAHEVTGAELRTATAQRDAARAARERLN
ncbi:MAG: hypothetical protein L0H31_07595, partial [Nocardioidaceae bacterium]|nr:hypothetical protein [Nocardioidaceae bacterium]